MSLSLVFDFILNVFHAIGSIFPSSSFFHLSVAFQFRRIQNNMFEIKKKTIKLKWNMYDMFEWQCACPENTKTERNLHIIYAFGANPNDIDHIQMHSHLASLFLFPKIIKTEIYYRLRIFNSTIRHIILYKSVNRSISQIHRFEIWNRFRLS